MESFTASLNNHSFKERTDCYTCMLRYAHTCSQVCYSICHMVSYLDNARVGLPSGTAHTQCTSYLRSLDYSDTGLWTAEDRERLINFFSLWHQLFPGFQRASVLPHHVAVSSHGVLWVAATGFTASLLTVVPVVRSTLIAVMAGHVLPTRTGSGLPVTVTLSITTSRLDGASRHTGTAWKHTRRRQ